MIRNNKVYKTSIFIAFSSWRSSPDNVGLKDNDVIQFLLLPKGYFVEGEVRRTVEMRKGESFTDLISLLLDLHLRPPASVNVIRNQ
jgi:hypothetical protein